MLFTKFTKLIQRRIGNMRTGTGRAYTDPERRRVHYRCSILARKSSWPAVCMYCGNVCVDGSDWTHAADTSETTAEHRVSICVDCSSKRFPQFYSDA